MKSTLRHPRGNLADFVLVTFVMAVGILHHLCVGSEVEQLLGHHGKLIGVFAERVLPEATTCH